MTDRTDRSTSDEASALASAQHRLHLILDAAGVACGWEWDIVSRTLVADARFAAMTNQDPVALENGVNTERFFASIHPEDLKRVKIAVAGILAGSEVFSKEYRILRHDGGYRWVHARGHAVLNADDKPVKFVGTLVDITDRKRSDEQLRIAQSAGGIGTFEHLMGYATLNVSEQFCRLFGLHPAKVLPVRTLNSLIHPEDEPIIDIGNPNGLQNERSIEFRVARADDGQERWLARRGEYVDDVESGSKRYVGVIFDITDAKRTQERLRLANEELSQIARESLRERDRVWKNSRDLLVVIGTDGVLRDISPSWQTVLGRTPADAVGKNVLDFVVTDDRDDLRPALKAVIDNARSDLGLRLLHADGTPRTISWSTAVEDDRVYAYGRDITVELQQKLALEHTQNQLRQSQKMEAVGQLTGGIAHDFNNMLTGVISALSIIKRRISAKRLDDLDKFIDAATTSAHRAASLTHRLLAFSRRQSLDRQALDINQLIGSFDELLRRTLGERIELQVSLGHDSLKVISDANQLENAILNLAINARDAMPDGGKLTIETTGVTFSQTDLSQVDELLPGTYVVIAVSDTGTGMSQDTIDKAFEPFFTTKPIGQGTGLGLSMIYGFAQQSGGHARIYSQLGVGTTIKLYLPANSGEVLHQKDVASTDAEPPRGEGKSILVVEDDDSVRMLVVDQLIELGYDVLDVADGTSALPLIEGKNPIDLLVSDVGLPGLNGRQLAEIALATRPDLRVLFITGYAAAAASRSDFLGVGMEMITKPFSIDDLARKVSEMLDGTARK